MGRFVTVAAWLVLAASACGEGEPCDRATYQGGCDGDRAWTYCADKTSTGREKWVARVVRHECEAQTVCVGVDSAGTCVAEPAETCEIVDATRCVEGRQQVCRDVDAITLASGVRYWYWLGGLSCE